MSAVLSCKYSISMLYLRDGIGRLQYIHYVKLWKERSQVSPWIKYIFSNDGLDSWEGSSAAFFSFPRHDAFPVPLPLQNRFSYRRLFFLQKVHPHLLKSLMSSLKCFANSVLSWFPHCKMISPQLSFSFQLYFKPMTSTHLIIYKIQNLYGIDIVSFLLVIFCDMCWTRRKEGTWSNFCTLVLNPRNSL